MVLTLLLIYNLSKEILQGISGYANQQYLVVLQDRLKMIRMLYEEGKIGEEEYRKLEKELAEAIKNVRAQQSHIGRRQQEVRLV